MLLVYLGLIQKLLQLGKRSSKVTRALVKAKKLDFQSGRFEEKNEKWKRKKKNFNNMITRLLKYYKFFWLKRKQGLHEVSEKLCASSFICFHFYAALECVSAVDDTDCGIFKFPFRYWSKKAKFT